MNQLTVLFFGDVFGKIGRNAIKTILPSMRERYTPDFVIANAENLAHGIGATPKTLQELIDAGVTGFTSGNHIFDKEDAVAMLEHPETWNLVRPANYPETMPGKGAIILEHGAYRLLMANFIGRVFFDKQDGKHTVLYENPFLSLDAMLEQYKNEKLHGIFVDFHAEATSEAIAFGHHCDSRVSAVVGTHTHIGTADAHVLPGGTAYITDVGMVGAKISVIGMAKESIIEAFKTDSKPRMSPQETGICTVSAVLVTIDPETKKAISIKRVDQEVMISG